MQVKLTIIPFCCQNHIYDLEILGRLNHLFEVRKRDFFFLLPTSLNELKATLKNYNNINETISLQEGLLYLSDDAMSVFAESTNKSS